MCNAYRIRQTAERIASFFGADHDLSVDVPAMIQRGSQGLVIWDGRLREMHWGLPRDVNRPGAPRFDPVAMNTSVGQDRDSWMGKDSFLRRRCLVPIDVTP